jgi:hypothetical protein
MCLDYHQSPEASSRMVPSLKSAFSIFPLRKGTFMHQNATSPLKRLYRLRKCIA